MDISLTTTHTTEGSMTILEHFYAHCEAQGVDPATITAVLEYPLGTFPLADEVPNAEHPLGDWAVLEVGEPAADGSIEAIVINLPAGMLRLIEPRCTKLNGLPPNERVILH